eukprot:scaffold17551_cov86-Skeletonema_marinoi.AAC.1
MFQAGVLLVQHLVSSCIMLPLAPHERNKYQVMNLPKAHSDTYGYGPRQQMAYSPAMRERCNIRVLEQNETIMWSVMLSIRDLVG